jgi:hypothetical protein
VTRKSVAKKLVAKNPVMTKLDQDSLEPPELRSRTYMDASPFGRKKGTRKNQKFPTRARVLFRLTKAS